MATMFLDKHHFIKMKYWKWPLWVYGIEFFLLLSTTVYFCYFDIYDLVLEQEFKTIYWIKALMGIYAIIFYGVLFVYLYLGLIWMSDFILGIICKDIIKRQHFSFTKNVHLPPKLPTVAIVVPVFNDFKPHPILQSFLQDYPNILRYILDDSTDQEMIKEIDEFALHNHVKVIRRCNYDWPNKGNYDKHHGLAASFDCFLNNTIVDGWDFMCHVDSGDIISHAHVSSALKLFYCPQFNNRGKGLGIVDICYTGYNVNSAFQNVLKYYGDDALTNTMLFKTHCGNFVMPGAGTVYSRQALQSVGHWPNMQCEDGCISIDIIRKGYCAMWSNMTYSTELNCLDVESFKKRATRIEKGIYAMIKNKFFSNHLKYYDKSVKDNKPNIFEKINTKLFIANYLYPPILFLILLILFFGKFFLPIALIRLEIFSALMFLVGLGLYVCIQIIIFSILVVPSLWKKQRKAREGFYSFLYFCYNFLFSIILMLVTLNTFFSHFMKKENKWVLTKKTVNVDKMQQKFKKIIWAYVVVLVVQVGLFLLQHFELQIPFTDLYWYDVAFSFGQFLFFIPWAILFMDILSYTEYFSVKKMFVIFFISLSCLAINIFVWIWLKRYDMQFGDFTTIFYNIFNFNEKNSWNKSIEFECITMILHLYIFIITSFVLLGTLIFLVKLIFFHYHPHEDRVQENKLDVTLYRSPWEGKYHDDMLNKYEKYYEYHNVKYKKANAK